MHILCFHSAAIQKEIRHIAQEQGFINADKPDSQDICFVPDGDYASFIEQYTGQSSEPGDFVNKEGKVLGKHKGQIHYTIGQRRGLGISAPESLCLWQITGFQRGYPRRKTGSDE